MKTDKKITSVPLEERVGESLPPYSIWIPLERYVTRISRWKRFKTRIKQFCKKKYRTVKE